MQRFVYTDWRIYYFQLCEKVRYELCIVKAFVKPRKTLDEWNAEWTNFFDLLNKKSI